MGEWSLKHHSEALGEALDYPLNKQTQPPEGLQGVVGDRHAGGEVQVLELGAELAETQAGAVCDLGAAVQVQHFDVPAVLGERPVEQTYGATR